MNTSHSHQPIAIPTTTPRFKSDNLIGQTFGRLKPFRRGPNAVYSGKSRSQFDCLCECGNVVTVQSQHLKTGRVQSCGCYRRDRIRTLSKAGLQTATTKLRKARRRHKREAIELALLQSPEMSA